MGLFNKFKPTSPGNNATPTSLKDMPKDWIPDAIEFEKGIISTGDAISATDMASGGDGSSMGMGSRYVEIEVEVFVDVMI